KLARDGQSLWILSGEARSLIQLGLDGFQTGARIKLPGLPADLDLSAEGAVVSPPVEGALAIVNLRQARLERVVATGPDVRTGRFHHEGRRIPCGNRGNRHPTVY